MQKIQNTKSIHGSNSVQDESGTGSSGRASLLRREGSLSSISMNAAPDIPDSTPLTEISVAKVWNNLVLKKEILWHLVNDKNSCEEGLLSIQNEILNMSSHE
ncbi:hypothetical protein QS306_09950 [Paraburkholderia bonniea]|uniref:hypothetical protein n=1 Tax=Paraburkholderia bonniea TaxID=2152891 RepID=UPI00129133A9|nr:hypothetical protein [Paraburkholderia bonniea]WJF89442.1 hypothetical protein QS306_09950 [Paraburkholderia bonniea]WJF92757.1 hypothetical protein QS308_09960 [Paraburkholderia bonniea]